MSVPAGPALPEGATDRKSLPGLSLPSEDDSRESPDWFPLAVKKAVFSMWTLGMRAAGIPWSKRRKRRWRVGFVRGRLRGEE